MNRRELMDCVAAAAFSALPANRATAGPQPEPVERPRCKITVIKKTVQEEAYEALGESPPKPCRLFEDRKEFLVTMPFDPPEGFCPWAWADIRPYVLAICGGGKRPLVACCTDGRQPVIFKLERADA